MISWLLVLVLTPLAVLLATRISSRIVMLLLLAICVYAPFVMEARISFLRGFFLLLFWTVWLSLIILWLSFKYPESMERAIWRSRQYTDAMMRWIETGRLPEGSAMQVVLFHSGQTLVYCAAALLSANFLSLLLGAGLLNYMNYYVASFAKKSLKPFFGFVVAWNPWSVIRVISFLWLGMAVSQPVLTLFFPLPWKLSLKLVMPAVAGVILDIVLKIALSRSWSLRLRHLTRKTTLIAAIYLSYHALAYVRP